MASDRTIHRVAAIVSNAGRLSVDVVSSSLTRHLDPMVGIQVHAVGSATEATARAEDAARTADIVIAVGGDGTVADVATGIFGSSAALGIVPAGSTNITARSLGVPETPEHALAVFGGRTHFRSIDLGRSSNRSFLHIAGAGFDAELFKIANPVWKRRVGWVAYLPAAIAALGLPTSEVRITADETEIVAQSSLVLIANGGSAIAPEFKIYPGISVEDGRLDVLVFTSTTPAEIAATLWHAGTQRLHQSQHVEWHPARSVRIEATPPLPVELDGNLHGETPCDFHVVPRGLDIVLPSPIS
jgi:YegS/Rv2252/BmrU family lipid kinase